MATPIPAARIIGMSLTSSPTAQISSAAMPHAVATDITPDQGGSGGSDAIETDGWLRNVISVRNMDLIYNIGDAVNKIGFGLVIYGLAVKSTAASKH